MERDRQIFFVILNFFCPFTPLTIQKIKILKKWKKKWLEIISFTQLYQKSWSYVTLFMRYDVWGMWFLFFILGYFLPFYHPNNQKNQNFRKMIKHLEISSFHTCTKNNDHIMFGSWDMVRDGWPDWRKDGWKKWHIEVGARPKKYCLLDF